MDQRRFIYSKCFVCKKMIRSYKFIQHMKNVHKQNNPTRPSERLLICFEHDPPQFFPLTSISSAQKRKFYQEHGNHMKNKFRVTSEKHAQFEQRDIIPISPPPQSFNPTATSTPQNRVSHEQEPGDISLSEILGLSDSNDVLAQAVNALEEEEQNLINQSVDLTQRIGQTEVHPFSIDQFNHGLNFIPAPLETLNEEDVSQYLSQFLPQHEALIQSETSAMARSSQGIDPTHQYSMLDVGEPRGRAVLDVGGPRGRAVLDVGEPRGRAVLDVGESRERSILDVGAPLQPTVLDGSRPVLDEGHQTTNVNAADYVRAMHQLNQITIRQLMADREQLDRHMQRTRQLMIDRMRDMLNEIEHQPIAGQHIMLDHFQRLQQIQDQFIQKLAQENASIQIPLYQLWEHL